MIHLKSVTRLFPSWVEGEWVRSIKRGICGWTGWYTTAGVDQVDSDWFRLGASGDNISLSAEGPLYVDIECDVLYLQDCQDDYLTLDRG